MVILFQGIPPNLPAGKRSKNPIGGKVWTHCRRKGWSREVGALSRISHFQIHSLSPIPFYLLIISSMMPGAYQAGKSWYILSTMTLRKWPYLLMRKEKVYLLSLGNLELVHPLSLPISHKIWCLIREVCIPLWLLVHHLACKLPTALQINGSSAILFQKSVVFQSTGFNNLFPLNILSSLSDEPAKWIWAVLDIRWHFPEPAGIFKHSGAFFVIDATSPCSIHPTWLDEDTYNEFHMRP